MLLALRRMPDRADERVDHRGESEDQRGDEQLVVPRPAGRLDSRGRGEDDADGAQRAGGTGQAGEHQPCEGALGTVRSGEPQQVERRVEHADQEVGDAETQDGKQATRHLLAQLSPAISDERDVGAPRQARQCDKHQPLVLHQTRPHSSQRPATARLTRVAEPESGRRGRSRQSLPPRPPAPLPAPIPAFPASSARPPIPRRSTHAATPNTAPPAFPAPAPARAGSCFPSVQASPACRGDSPALATAPARRAAPTRSAAAPPPAPASPAAGPSRPAPERWTGTCSRPPGTPPAARRSASPRSRDQPALHRAVPSPPPRVRAARGSGRTRNPPYRGRGRGSASPTSAARSGRRYRAAVRRSAILASCPASWAPRLSHLIRSSTSMSRCSAHRTPAPRPLRRAIIAATGCPSSR